MHVDANHCRESSFRTIMCMFLLRFLQGRDEIIKNIFDGGAPQAVFIAEMISNQWVVYARTSGNVARRSPFESILRKGLECRIQQLLLGQQAAPLLFSGQFFQTSTHIEGLMAVVFNPRVPSGHELVHSGLFKRTEKDYCYWRLNARRTALRFSTAMPFSITGSKRHCSTASIAA